MDAATIVWTDYVKYRVRMRGFDLAIVEQIVRYSSERYMDIVTGRSIAIGMHDRHLVMIPYEREGETLIPVTIHVTSRQQINFRVRSERLRHE